MSQGLPRAAQWALLLAASVALAGVLELLHVPAALLIGPMVAAVAAGANGAALRLSTAITTTAYSVIGVMVAASIEPALFGALLDDWAAVLAATVATLLASAFLGWLISYWNVMPGSTAIWGSAPGAASAMVLMAESFGADARLVAFMQYVRVIMVSVGAALVARLFVDTSGVEAAPTVWSPDLDPFGLAMTATAAAAGVGLGLLVRLPSPHFLGPMLVGIAMHAGGGIGFALPEWLLAAAYLFAGWAIGLRFDRAVLLHAVKSLPQVAAAVIALMLFCAAIGWAMARTLGTDPLTAYLATSPGGMDTVAIVAAASDGVDISFVMALQTMRMIIVLIFGPPLARWIASRI